MTSDGFTKSHPALPYYSPAVCSHRDAMAARHDINGLVREWTPFPAHRENDIPQTELYKPLILSHMGLLPPHRAMN
ncbi:hypothetical protein CesoFtcFv8_021601 [Champsocephalus esox]|uniref:Uncharacterized protein n=1 Tax=Champsocephalus esox TaxID=159716 RepID=A0AAN8B9Q6_9TELE|nr:hypothetical protein CesoFtcFv8_021601 [Champsocephalus esox]